MRTKREMEVKCFPRFSEKNMDGVWYRDVKVVVKCSRSYTPSFRINRQKPARSGKNTASGSPASRQVARGLECAALAFVKSKEAPLAGVDVGDCRPFVVIAAAP
ncbi:hypothetical protein MRB53_011100 [Persea americana]|uniref:Uncharacterized protein n=1 Tax=Persea americana TaxID=3435 RepID=A0ACC2LU14_PERAE|nr:hypothetical protein MRB53_011100 [Persea americana]